MFVTICKCGIDYLALLKLFRIMKSNTILLILFTILLFPQLLLAQPPFSIQLQPVNLSQAPAVQSFAHAEWQGKWLLLGGRTDGLHRRQPFATFAADGNNTRLYVVDITSGQVWQRSLTELPTGLREQLQSSNMEHYQHLDKLYLIGGYAYSASVDDHITFPYLTVANVPALIEAIIQGQPVSAHFQQLEDDRMAVTGGELGRIGDTFYLVGGQLFNGRYNPMGPDHGPGFEQVYTNSISRFRIENTQGQLAITDYQSWFDEVNLHRRDYNLVPQVFPNGEFGYTAFSGVFQHNQDLPFLNTVDVVPSGYTVNNEFVQYLSHYHSAKAPLYDSVNNTMHTLFFGGISQFYFDQNGQLVEDTDVPFVRTISCVSRFADGQMQEVRLPVEMPGLLGAGAAFIPLYNTPMIENDIINIGSMSAGQPVLIGYIVGGINSTQPNVFWLNGDDLSNASGQILAVYLTKTATTGLNPIKGENPLSLQLAPNPAQQHVEVKFSSPMKGAAYFYLQDSTGRIIRTFDAQVEEHGQYSTMLELDGLPAGVYYMHLTVGHYTRSQKLMVEK